MLRAENTVTIGKPVPEVFAFVTDGINAPKWRSGVLDIERVTGSGGVGTRYRQGVKGPGGRRVAADYEVTEYEADRLLAFRATAGPVRPRGWFRFDPADGGTRLTFSLETGLRGLKRIALQGAVSRSMQAEVGAIENVKRLLEQ